MIAHNPLHGSGQAELPHPALALGKDAHAAERIGMTDGRQWQPAVDETPHTVPKDATVLAAPRQGAMPEPSNLVPKEPQRRCVHGHPVVADMSTHHRLQPRTLFGDGFMHAPLKLSFHRVQLRLQSLAYRLPQHRKLSITSLLYADMRKAEKVERLRLPFSASLPVVDRERTKFQQPRLLGMQLQVELPHSLVKFRPKLIGIRFPLEAKHDIVRKTHHDHVAVGALAAPCLDPQVEHIMEVNVSQQRRSTTTLRRPFLHTYSLPILQHARVEPFLDQPHNAPICDPVLDELDQPFVGEMIEGLYDTLPIIRTFPRKSRLFAGVIHSKVNRSLFFKPPIGTVGCISY